jgi:hypothetical protein
MFTNGTSAKSCRDETGRPDAPCIGLAKRMGISHRQMTDGGHGEIFPAQQVGIGHQHDQRTDAKEDRRQHKNVDQQDQQSELDTHPHRREGTWRTSDRL